MKLNAENKKLRRIIYLLFRFCHRPWEEQTTRDRKRAHLYDKVVKEGKALLRGDERE